MLKHNIVCYRIIDEDIMQPATQGEIMTSYAAEHPGNTLISLPSAVIKRDGSRTAFDADKIRSAIQRAGQASGEFDASEAGLLSAQVVKVLIQIGRASWRERV